MTTRGAMIWNRQGARHDQVVSPQRRDPTERICQWLPSWML